MLCDYGCGNIATHYFKRSKKWCCEEKHQKCPSNRKKYSQPGIKNPLVELWDKKVLKRKNII